MTVAFVGLLPVKRPVPPTDAASTAVKRRCFIVPAGRPAAEPTVTRSKKLAIADVDVLPGASFANGGKSGQVRVSGVFSMPASACARRKPKAAVACAPPAKPWPTGIVTKGTDPTHG